MDRSLLPLRPVGLPPNYVWRSYRGGQWLRRFRGEAATGDDHFPEDWLASTVRARNGVNAVGPDEGLSRVVTDRGEVPLATSLTEHPEYWFGRNGTRREVGVLWKLLDAAQRLQLQAHPDANFARQHLGSSAGKTECWYILATRGPAQVWLGFQRAPTPETWGRMIHEQRVREMLECFDPIPVKAGDCFVVPAGVPHAIGAGIFMLELQEPTDWVVRCETRMADGRPLPPESCLMGLDLESCLPVFDYRSRSVAEVRAAWQQRPRVVRRGADYCEEEVIEARWHRYFRLHRLRGIGPASWPGGELMLAVVWRGRGWLGTADEPQAVCAGQTWLLPGCAAGWRWVGAGDEWELLLARLPRKADRAESPEAMTE